MARSTLYVVLFCALTSGGAVETEKVGSDGSADGLDGGIARGNLWKR